MEVEGVRTIILGLTGPIKVSGEVAAASRVGSDRLPRVISVHQRVTTGVLMNSLPFLSNFEGMRILVTLLLDTLPMLGNVLLLCFFVFFIFGIVGVQLWAGLLRNRCFLDDGIRT